VDTEDLARPAPAAADLLHLRPDNARGWLVVLSAAALTGAGIAMSLSAHWELWIAGQLVLAAALVQWFAILHECGHETLFRTRSWHAPAGRLAGFMAGIPYHSWIRVHGRHHKWTGWQDLDPTTEALVPRPRTRAELIFLNVCWRLWIPVFSVIYRVSNYWHLPRLNRLFPGIADRRAMRRDLLLLFILYAVIVAISGPALILRVAGLALVLSLAIQDLLILSQHTHMPQHVSGGAAVRPYPAPEQEPFTRSLRLPRWASIGVLHFDAHELHHMYPFVPGYHLARIPYRPANEVDWWTWVTGAKRVPANVLLFENRTQSGLEL
jgi:acyl-lipid omega-6 desaturase (Delta-12 desaturase)